MCRCAPQRKFLNILQRVNARTLQILANPGIGFTFKVHSVGTVNTSFVSRQTDDNLFFPIGHCINPANQSGACHFQQAFEVFVCNIQTVVSCLWAFCLRLQRITIRAIFSMRGHSKAEFFKEFLTNHIITVVYLPLIFLQHASAV